jgi:cobalamin biosynthesis protein CbiD
MTTDKKTLEKVGNLIKLANGADDEEARTAAIQAAKMMKEHELVLVPRSELERVQKVVQGAQALQATMQKEKLQNMAIGAMAGVFLGKQFKL